jgi:hypothetical protein
MCNTKTMSEARGEWGKLESLIWWLNNKAGFDKNRNRWRMKIAGSAGDAETENESEEICHGTEAPNWDWLRQREQENPGVTARSGIENSSPSRGKTRKAGAAKVEPIPDRTLGPVEMVNLRAPAEPCARLGRQHKKSSVDEKTAEPSTFSEHGPKTAAGNRIRQCLLAQELKIRCARTTFGASSSWEYWI